MTDCDLCGRGIPTVNPVRVFRPSSNSPTPKESGQASLENCLESADKTRVKVEKEELAGTPGKCNLCGSKSDFYSVELRISNFSKGVMTEKAILCKKCLKAAGKSCVAFRLKLQW